LLNIIIKQAFRETGRLKQIGRSPRFFDVSNPLMFKDIKVWSGFKASAVNTNMGLTLVIDNVFKFMSTSTCLERIRQIKQNSRTPNHFQQMVRIEFGGKSIIADWGNQRTYIVHDIDFDENPHTKTFPHKDGEISVAEYFFQAYQKKLTDF